MKYYEHLAPSFRKQMHVQVCTGVYPIHGRMYEKNFWVSSSFALEGSPLACRYSRDRAKLVLFDRCPVP